MKKVFILLAMCFVCIAPAISAVDKTSEEYLKGKKHVAIMNPVAESLVESVIRKSLKKETNSHYKVKFTGYNLSSMRKGIFKHLEITGNDVVSNGVKIPYINFKTITDYNWIDYKKNPVEFKSDMTFVFNMKLSEETLNTALERPEYQKNIEKINKIANPLFVVKGLKVRMRQDGMYLVMTYNFPIVKAKNDRTFIMSCDGFNVIDGKIKAKGVSIDSSYGNIPINKVINLINLLDPLTFTIDLMESNSCDVKIENVRIVDNMILVDGKVFAKKGAQ